MGLSTEMFAAAGIRGVWFVHVRKSRKAVVHPTRGATWMWNVYGEVSMNAPVSEVVFNVLETATNSHFEQGDLAGATSHFNRVVAKIEVLMGKRLERGPAKFKELFGV